MWCRPDIFTECVNLIIYVLVSLRLKVYIKAMNLAMVIMLR